MVVCMVSMLISFLVKSGMCIKYPSSNKLHPHPPVNDSSWRDATYPNCTNYTAVYTGLSSHTLAGNIYGLYDLKGSPYSITEHRVLELVPVLGSQPAGDMNHKPDDMLPLLSARPAVIPATLKMAATNFAAW